LHEVNDFSLTYCLVLIIDSSLKSCHCFNSFCFQTTHGFNTATHFTDWIVFCNWCFFPASSFWSWNAISLS